ncbi:2-C-methyl-D-erythritol 4-phosphate cytidylyltransferase [Ruminococcus sp. CLA-AA-H200]|uniref:2-C-methyl-D-erythritol 4-phosphate cytidylyltransferase n=1 Tax=Ruminococcus turbiniformis TaxID=2881258 RepID=A0ABS8FYB1_9FIRM|nr:2-C-methyl-D-erythritol 4-phosphate cytidylyltransferase [Ruminococcus turbiniformis]MCC2255050.1 2-C-methyl-D-erythritol 4-phosphate cytidylyltransferase [Ruminococcus turbiniformis]
MAEKKYCTAIVLAAGSGRRMGTKVHKQYLILKGKPVLYYSLKTFQDSGRIDEIILVTGSGEEEFCRREITEKFGITKVKKIIPGGAERYHSVWNGLKETKPGYVFIHDGARPFVTDEMIQRAYDCVRENRACVAGMPSKDTVKIVDEAGTVVETPDRKRVWQVQTPQVFETELVKKAYSMLMEKDDISVTDDAMVVEQMLGLPVRLFEGSYQNIKITTPEDLDIADVFLK